MLTVTIMMDTETRKLTANVIEIEIEKLINFSVLEKSETEKFPLKNDRRNLSLFFSIVCA
jgi:hypothetical protein